MLKALKLLKFQDFSFSSNMKKWQYGEEFGWIMIVPARSQAFALSSSMRKQ